MGRLPSRKGFEVGMLPRGGGASACRCGKTGVRRIRSTGRGGQQQIELQHSLVNVQGGGKGMQLARRDALMQPSTATDGNQGTFATEASVPRTIASCLSGARTPARRPQKP